MMDTPREKGESPLSLHPAMAAAIAEEVTRQTAPLFAALTDLAASNGRFALSQLAFNGALIDRLAEAEMRLAAARSRLVYLDAWHRMFTGRDCEESTMTTS